MQNALVRNRVFAIVTAAAMILGSLGATFAPSVAQAASGGDLIKGTSLSTVYYYGYDGARYTFPNEKTFMTWFEDFDDVETISDSALADISLAGNVAYRPGSRWVKITSDPKVYAVSTDGALHWVESEEVAEDFAGSDWASFIDDVPDVFFTDYESGTSLTTAAAYEGMMYMDGSSYYIIWDGEMRMVSAAGRSANNMQSRFFLDGSSIDDSAYSSGDDITSEVSALTDVAQQGGDTGTATGDVTVKLSSSNPDGTSVPTNANSLEVLSFDLKAGSEAAEVDQIAVKLVGLSSTTDVSNVYLYEGNTRLSEARAVNSSTLKATFGSLGLDLDAGETRTITVRVTISASAGDEIQFAIYESGDVDAGDGSISGSFPVEGETFEVSSVTAGTVTIIDTGSIDNPSLGDQNAEIGKFKITTATEAGDVDSLTLKIDNATDHSDFVMWADDAEVATGEYIGDKLVVFDFATAFTIAKGQSETFTVTADVGGEAADTIKVYMDNAIDVEVVGGTYGFAMAATITGYDASSTLCDGGSDDECNYSTIQGGEVTFSTSGPNSGDIRTNSQDQTLLEFSIVSLQDITVKDLDIIVVADDNGDNDPFDATDDSAADADADADGLVNTSTEANITDIKIVNADTGETLMGPLELDALTDAASADDADQTIDFTDDFEMSAGETLNLAVVVDVDDTLTSGTELGAIIDISGFAAEDENGDTLTNSTDVVPSSDMYEGAQRALAASLVVTLSTVPGDVTTIHGMEDVAVGKFNFTGGDAGPVDISSITMDVYLHDAATGDFSQAGNCSAAECAVIGAIVTVTDYLESCSIYDIDGNLIDGPKSTSSSGSLLVFDDMDWTIEAGEAEALDLRCNFSNPVLATTVYFAFDIDDLSELILVEDEDGTDVDPTTDSPNGDYSDPTNVVTLASGGTIAVTADSGMPSADLLLTGSTDNHVASYRFTATNEDFEVLTLSFSEEQAEDDTGSADSSGYANNIELVTISYPIEDGTTTEATGTISGNEAKFSLSSVPMYVSTGDSAVVDVSVDVPASDRSVGGAATSNEKIRMGWFIDATNDDNFKAIGVGSNVTYTDTDSDGSGTDFTAIGNDYYTTDGVPTFVVRETRPTISLSSSSPSGTKVPGDIEVYRFNVAASSNEDVIIRDLIWKLSATDNGNGSWNFYDPDAGLTGDDLQTSDFDLYNLSKDGTSTALDDDAEWTFLASTAADAAEDAQVYYVQLELSSDAEALVVPAGDTYTFALYMDTTGASATNDDSIQLSLIDDSTLSWINPSLTVSDGALAIGDTTVILSGNTGITAGDLMCFSGTADTTCDAGEEIALITSLSTNTVSLVRGYLGTDFILPVTGDAIIRRPGSFFWEDDGTSGGLTTVNNAWGAYLVDSLPVTGNTIQF